MPLRLPLLLTQFLLLPVSENQEPQSRLLFMTILFFEEVAEEGTG
jgi:hypothetical protein